MILASDSEKVAAFCRQFGEHRSQLLSLFDAFLPPALPSSSKVAFDSVSISSAVCPSIGGDWCDAFQRVDKSFAFSIGDVEGHGASAAASMEIIRAALFVLDHVCVDPEVSLQNVDDFIDRECPGLFTTAFDARYDPITHRLRYANAGHPAPFVRRIDGSLRRLAPADVPLGAGRIHGRCTHDDELQAGDLLIAFTDGLSEMTSDIEEGECRIARALANPAFATASKPAAMLLAALVRTHPRDDIAILTLRVWR